MSTIFFNNDLDFQMSMYPEDIPLLPQEPVILNPITEYESIWDCDTFSKYHNQEWQNDIQDGMPILTLNKEPDNEIHHPEQAVPLSLKSI